MCCIASGPQLRFISVDYFSSLLFNLRTFSKNISFSCPIDESYSNFQKKKGTMKVTLDFCAELIFFDEKIVCFFVNAFELCVLLQGQSK